MINAESKAFGIYLFTQLVQGMDKSFQDQWLTRIRTLVPGIEAGAAQGVDPTFWEHQVAPKVVGYYGDHYKPGNLRATG